jgi:hypothetical protein
VPTRTTEKPKEILLEALENRAKLLSGFLLIWAVPLIFFKKIVADGLWELRFYLLGISFLAAPQATYDQGFRTPRQAFTLTAHSFLFILLSWD